MKTEFNIMPTDSRNNTDLYFGCAHFVLIKTLPILTQIVVGLGKFWNSPLK